MSFSGGALNVGNLTATFSLNASAATATITNVMTQTTALKNSLNTTYKINVDNSTAITNINNTSGAIKNLKSLLEFTGGIAAFALLEKGIRGVVGATAEWQTQLAQLMGNTTLTTAQVKELDGAVRSLAATTPTGMNDLAAAFRHVANEGYSGADAIKLVTEANMSAISTGSKTADVANTLAIVMHTFGINTEYAAQTMNVLHLAAATGNLTLEQFVEAGGKVFSTAASVGLSITEVSAAYATLTKEGYDAAESSTILTGLIQKIIGPSAGATKELQALSRSSGIDLVSEFSAGGLAANGLAKVIDDVARATGNNTTEIFKLLPALRGGRGEMVLGGAGAKDYADSLNLLNDAWAGKTNPTLAAFNTISQTTNYQWGVAKNTIRLFALELGTVLLPYLNAAIGKIIEFGDALGKVFNVPGLSTLKAGWDANKKMVDDTTAALGQATQGVKDFNQTPIQTDADKMALAGFKQTVDAAGLAIADLTKQLDDNKIALDANAAAIQKVKGQYDPIIANATKQIHDINVLTPDELARKERELELDRDKANLDLTRPDTSLFDANILGDQTALANMPRLDTSGWDTKIENAQAALSDLQGKDPAAGVKGRIADLQQAISDLNTDELDRKINAIQDKLAEPPPDTHGIVNQMTTLEEQLAGGQIGQADFNARYGALARQKAGVNQQYTDDTNGLKGQLKLLERERADQRLANQETARADKERIEDLKVQQKTIEDANKAAMDGLKATIKEQEKARTDAQQKDAKARQDLSDDIRKNENDRTLALKPYTDALKKINDEQERNATLDRAAAAQRALDLAPWQKALDDAKDAEDRLLEPLNKQKETLDGIKTSLNEQKATQSQIRMDAEAHARALKDGATNAANLGDALKQIPFSKYDEFGHLFSEAAKPATYASANLPTITYDEFGQKYDQTPDSPILAELKKLKKWLDDNEEEIRGKWAAIVAGFKAEVKLDLGALFEGVDFVKAVSQLVYDLSQGNWGAIRDDLGALQQFGLKPNATLVGVGQTGGGPNGNGQEITFGPNTAPGGYYSARTDLGPVNPGPAGGYGAQAPGTPSGPDGSPFEQFLAANIQSAGDTASKIKEIFNDMFGGFGGKKVAAGNEVDIQKWDDYAARVQKAVGPDGDATKAVTDFNDATDKAVGGDGTVAQSLGTSVADWDSAFGDRGDVPQVLKEMRDSHIPLTVTNIRKAFAAGGDIPAAFGIAGDAATKTFGANGTFDQATTNVTAKTAAAFGAGGTMDTHLTAFDGKVGGVLGTGGSAQTDMTDLDAHTAGIFGPGGSVVGYLQSLSAWLNGEWQSIAGALAKPFTDAQAPIQSFWSFLGGGIGWLAEHFNLPAIVPYTGAGADNAAIHASIPGHAAGLGGGMPAHVAMVGERGPELMVVPAGASIVPNHLLPGHAAGLNMDGLLDGLGGILAHNAGKLVDGMMAGLGTPTIPGIAGAGGALGTQIAGGLKTWLAASTVENPPSVGGKGRGGPLGPLVSLINAAASRYGLPADIIGAIILHESGGIIGRVEDGGGLGRGLMQVDGGTWPEAFDPRMVGTSLEDAAFQIDTGAMILKRSWPDGAGVEQALTGYAGAGFAGVHGRTFYRELLDMGLIAQADAALAPRGASTGAVGGDGLFMRPVNGPITQPWGQTGFFLEPGGFHDGVDFGVPIGTPVMADASGVVDASGESGIGYGNWVRIQTDNYETWTGHMDSVVAGIGDMVRKGELVGYSGNTGASTGPHVHWGAHLNGQSVDPLTLPGLKDGAYVTSPTLAMIGEGRSPEIVAPEPKLREAVRDGLREAGGAGGGLHVHGPITIQASSYAQGQAAAEGFMEYLAGKGYRH